MRHLVFHWHPITVDQNSFIVAELFFGQDLDTSPYFYGDYGYPPYGYGGYGHCHFEYESL